MTVRWNARPLEAGAPPSLSAPARQQMYLDARSQLSGKLRVQRDVRIDGQIEGEIECAGTVTVGPSGQVRARVRASSVIVDGEVHGDIDAQSEITLRRTARVHGDLTTEGIVIERGAKLEGRITIGPATAAAPALADPAAAKPLAPPKPAFAPPEA